MSSPDSKEINFVRCLKCFKILMCSRYDTAALLDHIRIDHPEIDIVDTDTKQKRSPPMKIQNPSLHSIKANSELDDEIREYRCTDDECASHDKNHNVYYENNEDVDKEHRKSKQVKYVKDINMAQYSMTPELLEKYPEIKESEYCPHNPNAQVVYTRRYKVNTPSVLSIELLQSPHKRSMYRTSIEKWRPGFCSIYCPNCGHSKRPLIKSQTEHFTNNDCGTCCLLSCWPFCFIPWLFPRQNLECLHCAYCKTFLGLYDPNTNCIKPNRLYVPTTQDGQCVIKNKNRFKNIKKRPKPAKHSQIPEPASTSPASTPSSGNDSSTTNSKHLPSVVVDGKELPPETVARIQKFKKFGSMVGIDMDTLTDKESPTTRKRDKDGEIPKEKQAKTPSIVNRDKQNAKNNT